MYSYLLTLNSYKVWKNLVVSQLKPLLSTCKNLVDSQLKIKLFLATFESEEGIIVDICTELYSFYTPPTNSSFILVNLTKVALFFFFLAFTPINEIC